MTISGVNVRVLVAGVFNDADHHALPFAHVGDEITVAGGDYAESLRADGLVALVDGGSEQDALSAELAALQAEIDALETKGPTAVEQLELDMKSDTEEPGGPSSPQIASGLHAQAAAKDRARGRKKSG